MISLSIRSKLILGFSIALISSVVISYMSILSLDTTYAEMNKYMEWGKMDETMNEAVIQRVITLDKILTLKNLRNNEELSTKASKAFSDLDEGVTEWSSLLEDHIELKDAAGPVQEKIANIKKINTQIDDLTARMKTLEGEWDGMVNEDTVHGMQYKTLVDTKEAAAVSENETISSLLAELRNIMETRVDPAKAATIAKAQSVKTEASAMALRTLLAAILVVIFIGLFIYRSISTPLKRAMIFSAEIAKGNLDAELKVNNEDEIGKMCRALAEVPKVLKMIMNRIAHTTDKIEVGNLRDVISDEGLQGEFKSLVARINHCSESYLEIIDAIPLPLMAINLEYTILYFNKTAQELGGFKNREQYHGKTQCWDVFKTSDCQTEKCACSKAMKTMQSGYSETDAHPQNMDLEIKYIAIPLTDSTEKVCGAFEVVIDQTEIVSMQRKVANLADQASDISKSLAESSQSLTGQIEQANQGAKIQSERATETATAMEEMNATVMEVAQNASHAAENTTMTMKKALEGKSSVDAVVLAIGKINQQTQTLKADMVSLGTQAESIGHVIEVISDIADQTNLLALNAAIEAARAGEAGRGFAVVADEVRKLAERTMTATIEVNNAISAVQDSCKRNVTATDTAAQEVGNSTSLVDKAGDILAEIVGYAEDSSGQVASIATASEEQSAAAEEISRSSEDVNRISLETGHAMNDAAQSVSQVNKMVHSLDKLIQEMVKR
ncbi:methyl-accepting chemotaxis protein [Desulfovibrio gilichinskyi]|uniref:Methyl-accepting chemotaxis sensory transducer with Pas/Pac sensor n=1 Tax=Desulfovibrio gilichinskyi TaxID=1519643 RepID=A0A1X7E7H7_9BACT|nr:methyl-accepting chemotaxis protein [Desulfovibrio gilichinskyi]SMF28756.1 methyl-accepting chemotaxis sensory transducer with Pas/Pac sensor [Desulfovibrio gilichinskyi]